MVKPRVKEKDLKSNQICQVTFYKKFKFISNFYQPIEGINSLNNIYSILSKTIYQSGILYPGRL